MLSISYSGGASQVLLTGATVGLPDFSEYRIGANVFWQPVSGLDLGVEVIYANVDPRGRIAVPGWSTRSASSDSGRPSPRSARLLIGSNRLVRGNPGGNTGVFFFASPGRRFVAQVSREVWQGWTLPRGESLWQPDPLGPSMASGTCRPRCGHEAILDSRT